MSAGHDAEAFPDVEVYVDSLKSWRRSKFKSFLDSRNSLLRYLDLLHLPKYLEKNLFSDFFQFVATASFDFLLRAAALFFLKTHTFR